MLFRSLQKLKGMIKIDELEVPHVWKKIYTATLVNTGKFTEIYSITSTGANWIALSDNFIELEPGESKEIEIKAQPDTIEGDYIIKVNAELSETSILYESASDEGYQWRMTFIGMFDAPS